MDKWTGIAVTVMLLAVFGGIAIKDVVDSQNAVEMAKAGLEECPLAENYRITVWVKDCVKYKKQEKETK